MHVVDAEAGATEAQLYRRFAEEHLAAAGFPNPGEVLDQIYEELTPPDEAFMREVSRFEREYLEAMEKAAYLRAIEERAGDDAQRYRELFELGRTKEGRIAHGGSRYAEAVAAIPAFNPPSKADYYARFDAPPDDVHRNAYEKALQMAVERLKGK